MARKVRNVVMNGNSWGKYELSFLTYFKLQFIRLYLWFLRWGRRIKRGLGYCKYTLVVIPLWIIYFIVIYYWGNAFEGNYPIHQLLWDTKSSLFTSIVITAITSFTTEYSKKKGAFFQQHRIYTDTMEVFSRLYKDLLRLLCSNDKKEYVAYWPFYTDKLRDTIPNEFFPLHAPDVHSPEYSNVMRSFSECRRTLDELSKNINTAMLAECNIQAVNEKISRCNSSLSFLERTLFSHPVSKRTVNCLSGCAWDFYKLIELLRYPWRRDLRLKLISLDLIYAEDKKIAETFYNSAFLNKIDYKFYENLADDTHKIIRSKNGIQIVKVRRKTRA